MKIIEIESKCTGCSACASVCPQQCISMVADEEGFLFPVIDEEKCIKCGKCRTVCSKRADLYEQNKDVLVAYNRDEKTRIDSSSGGIFSALAIPVLEQGGVVFGAAFDDDFQVNHIGITTTEDLYKVRGSKYVQSKIGNSYKQAKDYLNSNRKVLFSGTPCQIAGLRSYLGKGYDNLICVDIICMGVSSPYVWESYKNENNLKLKKFDFRNKTNGWRKSNLKYTNDDGTFEETHKENTYMQTFFKLISLRKSCYQCDFKCDDGKADITIGDCWGYENFVELPQNHNIDLGLSVLIQRTENGKKYMQTILDKLVVIKSEDYKEISKYNPRLETSANCPEERFVFFDDLRTQGLDKALKKNMPLKRDKKTIQLMEFFIDCITQQNVVEEKLIEKGYCKIAIYGMGTIGRALYSLLKGSKKIETLFYIDNKEYADMDINYQSKSNMGSIPFDEVDAIIVTPTYCYGNILFQLRQYTNKPIIGMNEMLF